MEDNWKFCTIETKPNNEEFEATVKVDKSGSSKPKDVWYYGEWIRYKKFRKQVSNNYHVHSYRNEL